MLGHSQAIELSKDSADFASSLESAHARQQDDAPAESVRTRSRDDVDESLVGNVPDLARGAEK